MKKNLNINVNKDDFSLNDYLLAWEQFGERPSKIIFYEPLDFETFMDFLSNYNYSQQCSLTEVFPVGDTNLINKRITLSLHEQATLSYTHLDSDSEENIVTEITLLFSTKSKDFINEFLPKFEPLFESEESDTDLQSNTNTFTLSLGTSGLELNNVKFVDIDQKNIDNYYNDDTLKQVRKICKSFKKFPKGLSLIYGERGTGKTSLIKYLSKKVNKNFIFVPCSFFETIVSSPEFRNFLNRIKDSIIILDDSDIYFSELYSKSNIFTNSILQLVDGLDSDDYNLHIISILNVKEVDQIDHILLECNNLIDVINVNGLEKIKIKDLCNHLKIKNKFSEPTNLRNILKKRDNFIDTKDIGFI